MKTSEQILRILQDHSTPLADRHLCAIASNLSAIDSFSLPWTTVEKVSLLGKGAYGMVFDLGHYVLKIGTSAEEDVPTNEEWFNPRLSYFTLSLHWTSRLHDRHPQLIKIYLEISLKAGPTLYDHPDYGDGSWDIGSEGKLIRNRVEGLAYASKYWNSWDTHAQNIALFPDGTWKIIDLGSVAPKQAFYDAKEKWPILSRLNNLST